jgi:hypothetical protein
LPRSTILAMMDHPQSKEAPMSSSFPRCAGRALVVMALGALLAGSAASSAVALCRLPSGTTPGNCAYSGTGAGLTIDATGSGAPAAMAILGAASKGNGIKGTTSGAKSAGMFAEGTGTAGYGLYAVATDRSGTGGAAIQGYHTGIGDAGDFYIDNADLTKSQTALSATNAGGGGGVGNYGNAGVFTIANSANASAALTATGTFGDGVAGASTQVSGVSGTSIYCNGVTGINTSADAIGDGVYGSSANNGVHGYSPNGAGVYGTTDHGYAAYFTIESTGASVSFNGGSSWNFSSDRNLKEDFRAVDAKDILRRLADMPVLDYRWKQQKDPSVRWLGPMAQDFKAAFDLGETDDTRISEGNEMGVALAAIQGLYAELRDRDARIAALEESTAKFAADHERMTADRNEIAALKQALANQNALLARLQASMTSRLQDAGVREAKLSD